MPAKKDFISDAERARRIRETARDVGTDNDPKSFERAFASVVRAPKPPDDKPEPEKK